MENLTSSSALGGGCHHTFSSKSGHVTASCKLQPEAVQVYLVHSRLFHSIICCQLSVVLSRILLPLPPKQFVSLPTSRSPIGLRTYPPVLRRRNKTKKCLKTKKNLLFLIQLSLVFKPHTTYIHIHIIHRYSYLPVCFLRFLWIQHHSSFTFIDTQLLEA